MIENNEQYSEHLKNVWNYLCGVKKSMEMKNRYFFDNDFSIKLKEIFEDRACLIEPNEILYRARLYTEADQIIKRREYSITESSDFRGYDKANSFVNYSSKWARPGRMNPEGIQCLYAATDIDTCIKELSPGFNELVSVAEIKVLDSIRYADLSMGVTMCDDDFSSSLSIYIQDLITQGGNCEMEYLFPQYIAECCKSFGYDALAYRSKYCSRSEVYENKGVNIAIFNLEKCEPIRSYLYTVDEIFYKSRPL